MHWDERSFGLRCEMKEIVMVLAVAFGAVFLWRRKRITGKGAILAGFLAASGLIYCLFRGFSGEWIPVTEIEKGTEGSSGRKVELQVQLDQDPEQKISLSIPSVQLSEEEAEARLTAFCGELDQEILGENSSLMEICYPLLLKNTYSDPAIHVEWQTDAPGYLSWEGQLGPGIPEEGVEVLLKGELSLQDRTEAYERRVKVFPSKAVRDLPERIRTEAERLNSDGREAVYHLPSSLDDQELRWYQGSDSSGSLMIGTALLLLGALVLVKQQAQREEARKRSDMLDQEYPDLVSKMQMLLGAGLSMRMVLDRIGKDYKASLETESRRKGMFLAKKKKSLVGQEILTSCRELENGLSEAEVYRRLGSRCNTPLYRGLTLMLEQNMTKGGEGLIHLLEQEAMEAFESRQRRARQEGEKVSVRLLLPMGMMLMIVLAMIMIPAFLSV